MPEVILPCPTNGCAGIGKIYHSPDQLYVTMLCVTCGLSTGYAINPEEAIARWNALPRALRWTYEPPKVAGKYWWRPVGKKIGRIRDMFVRNGEVGFLDHNDRFIKDTGDGEWAGPISPPID